MSEDRQQIPGNSNWIFDLDGTLTVAAHDFSAIRSSLGIAPQTPILEALAAMPEWQARQCMQQLERIEGEVAEKTVVAEGALELLQFLINSGVNLGIVTRNSKANAHRTLVIAGLSTFFEVENVITRDNATPKPSPAGINCLLDRWSVKPSDAMMIGDYLFDIEAGRAAGTQTVLIGSAHKEWATQADFRATDLCDLRRRIGLSGCGG